MSAELNSVANGRLQVVFHIKGKSDPPTRQVAEVAIADIINGTALYKPIPLPSGTPIDLTLDTSLNFDELLKFLCEAWSKSLGCRGNRTNSVFLEQSHEKNVFGRLCIAGDWRLYAHDPGRGGADQYLRQARRRCAGAVGQGSPDRHFAKPRSLLACPS